MDKKRGGFTLIEVIIAISILGTLSVLIGISTSRALKSKRKIQAEVHDVSSLRDALRVIRADISQAYNHFDFEKELLDLALKPEQGKVNAPGLPPQTPQGLNPVKRENKRGDPRTDFIGESDKISFVTMNQARFMTGEMTADFIEVGYVVKACRSIGKILGRSGADQTTSNCLFRRTQKIIDADVTVGGVETVMLENVKEFTLKYLGEGKTDWKNEWKSKGGIDTTLNKQFPEAVEVNLSIETELDKKKRDYSLQAVVPIHFPNNIKPKQNSASGSSSNPETGTQTGGGPDG